MIAELLQREEFKNNPPVLLDIGASGSLPEIWKEIAPYCICVAFDGDERDFNYIEEKKKQFRKLIIVNKVVSVSGKEIDFHLTKSPHCSSTLKPDIKNLSNYRVLLCNNQITAVNYLTLSNHKAHVMMRPCLNFLLL